MRTRRILRRFWGANRLMRYAKPTRPPAMIMNSACAPSRSKNAWASEPSGKDARLSEGLLGEHVLLQLVAGVASRRRARALRAGDDSHGELLPEPVPEVREEEVGGPHIARLFLYPDEIGARGVRFERFVQSR